MNEKEWLQRRQFSKKELESIIKTLQFAKSGGTLLQAEKNICDTLILQVNSILYYWSERSVASRIRFVKGAKDE